MSPDTDPPLAGEENGVSCPTDPNPTSEKPDSPYAGLSTADLYEKLAERRREKTRRQLIDELENPPPPPEPEPKDNPPDRADLKLANSAKGLQECLNPLFGKLPLEDVVDYLKAGLSAPGDPADIEHRLETQARVLDSAFGRLIEAAMKNKSCDAAVVVAALKTQKHYRDTIRALGAIQKEFKKRDKKRDKKMMETNYWIPESARENKE